MVVVANQQPVPGPPGPEGPPGPPGNGVPFEHVQGAPAQTWVVAHGLGTFPSVVVIDSAGTHLEADVTYVDANTLTISFSGATSGRASLHT